MGRGDKRTKKGKIAAGSFGNSRPQKVKKVAVKAAKKKAAKKK
jgi:30S ribosomal protein S31